MRSSAHARSGLTTLRPAPLIHPFLLRHDDAMGVAVIPRLQLFTTGFAVVEDGLILSRCGFRDSLISTGGHVGIARLETRTEVRLVADSRVNRLPVCPGGVSAIAVPALAREIITAVAQSAPGCEQQRE